MTRPLLAAVLLAATLSGCFGPVVPDPCPAAPDPPAADPRHQVAADAGPDLEVQPGDSVFLDGSGSRDLRGRPLTYLWHQLEGPCVSLDLPDPSRPTFTAPAVPEGGSVLRFRLVVHAEGEFSEASFVHVFVGRTEAGS